MLRWINSNKVAFSAIFGRSFGDNISVLKEASIFDLFDINSTKFLLLFQHNLVQQTCKLRINTVLIHVNIIGMERLVAIKIIIEFL